MRETCTYDYAVIRVVPRVEREEFVNAGIVLSCPARDFLEARVELDEARVAALDPTADFAVLREHLYVIPRICRGGAQAGPIGLLPARERFHWVTATRSTVIQCSAVHTGRCGEPQAVLDHLLTTRVHVRTPTTRRATLAGARRVRCPRRRRRVEVRGWCYFLA